LTKTTCKERYDEENDEAENDELTQGLGQDARQDWDRTTDEDSGSWNYDLRMDASRITVKLTKFDVGENFASTVKTKGL